MLSRANVIGVDVGSENSGLVGLLEAQISIVKIIPNGDVFDELVSVMSRYERTTVVIEDIKPYAGNLSQQAIDTCKFIGELSWRLKEIQATFVLRTRSQVRKWVYDNFFELILPLVVRKIAMRNEKNKDGKDRKPSFVYVDDGMVLKAMKCMFGIETPPPGKGYIHGLKSHTWQALALACSFMQQNPES